MHKDSDIDLLMAFQKSIVTDNDLLASFSRFQGEAEAWAHKAQAELGHRISIHNGHPADPPDFVTGTVLAGRVIHVLRKAQLTWTPAKQ